MFRRYPSHEVETALTDTRVVLLNGARQVGKSTLARRLADERGGQYRTLDDPAVAAAAQADPEAFVQAGGDFAVIDEVQMAPSLFPAIKRVVDRDARPGRFLLTGSPNLADVPVLRRLKARLSNSRVQPEVAHQLRGRCKARDIPDSRKQADRHDAVHACDRQQPLQLIVMENRLAEKPVDRVEVLAETVKFPQALFDCQPLVHGQRLLGQPYPALAPK